MEKSCQLGKPYGVQVICRTDDGGIGEPVVAMACGKARAKRAVLAHTAVGTQARSSRECWYKSDPYTFLWADIYS